ncbi:MAG: tetratricopeptide repeat protein [Acidobacteriaceae bacterium]|nr:tetratricopeptide repeat protein [Acidobacteriaceae bacterium]
MRRWLAVLALFLCRSLSLPALESTDVRQLLAAKDYGNALKKLNEMPSSAQQTAWWHSLTSEAYAGLNRPAEAVAECEKAIAAEPAAEKWHLQLGQIFLAYHTPKAAVDVFRETLAAFPQSVMARLGLGLAHKDLELYEEAEADLRECLRQTPDLALAFDSLATIYLNTKRFDDLAQLSREFRRVNPQDYRSYYFEAAALAHDIAQITAAEGLVQEALRRNSRFAAAYALMGKIKLDQGHPADALPYLKRATALRPDYSSSFFYLSRAYRLLGRQREAEQATLGFQQAKQAENAPIRPLSYRRGHIEGNQK